MPQALPLRHLKLETRHTGALATCNIVTTSNAPNGGSLSEEFIILLSREFANDLPPGNAIVTGSTRFANSGGSFTVTKTTGGTELTADETRNIMRAWAGQNAAGAGQVGVGRWTVDQSELRMKIGCPRAR